MITQNSFAHILSKAKTLHAENQVAISQSADTLLTPARQCPFLFCGCLYRAISRNNQKVPGEILALPRHLCARAREGVRDRARERENLMKARPIILRLAYIPHSGPYNRRSNALVCIYALRVLQWSVRARKELNRPFLAVLKLSGPRKTARGGARQHFITRALHPRPPARSYTANGALVRVTAPCRPACCNLWRSRAESARPFTAEMPLRTASFVVFPPCACAPYNFAVRARASTDICGNSSSALSLFSSSVCVCAAFRLFRDCIYSAQMCCCSYSLSAQIICLFLRFRLFVNFFCSTGYACAYLLNVIVSTVFLYMYMVVEDNKARFLLFFIQL